MMAKTTAQARLLRVTGFRLLDAADLLEFMEGEEQPNVCEICDGNAWAVPRGGGGSGGLGCCWVQDARRSVHTLVAKRRCHVINEFVIQ
jgi:hypothetical protein